MRLHTEHERPQLWTDERGARYRQNGTRPDKVMVWTPAMAGQFLDAVAQDRLYALWHLAVYWGPRRGELVALERADVRTDAARVTIRGTKTDNATRSFTVDQDTAEALETWFEVQMAEQMAAGPAWQDTGRVFTHEDGTALTPHYVTKRFLRLIRASGLPPVRFHDLRHGAATYLIHAMGGAQPRCYEDCAADLGPRVVRVHQ